MESRSLRFGHNVQPIPVVCILSGALRALRDFYNKTLFRRDSLTRAGKLSLQPRVITRCYRGAHAADCQRNEIVPPESHIEVSTGYKFLIGEPRFLSMGCELPRALPKHHRTWPRKHRGLHDVSSLDLTPRN